MLSHDYEVIGSIGFAQVGTGEYFAKEQVEKKVIVEIIDNNPQIFKVPIGLIGIARLTYKGFSHDFGTYYELCVIYDDSLVCESEEIETELWDWINNMQEFDFESEEIIERCNELYRSEVVMTATPGGKQKENTNHLKIV